MLVLEQIAHSKQENGTDVIHTILEIGKIISYLKGEINCSVTVASVSGKSCFVLLFPEISLQYFLGFFPLPSCH